MREIIAALFPGLDLRHHYGHHQSPAIRAGGSIFCSGMVAIHPEAGEREHGTVTSEARRIFENLKLHGGSSRSIKNMANCSMKHSPSHSHGPNLIRPCAIGVLQIHVVPGDHLSMIHPPYVQVLADQLMSYLARGVAA